MTQIIVIPTATENDPVAYSNRGHVEDIFGATNVRAWANIDADDRDDTIAARITWANLRAYYYINDKLHGGRYEIPFPITPESMVYTAAQYAGFVLYSSRGIRDADESVNHMFQHHGMEVDKTLRMIRAGQISFHDVMPKNTNVPMAEGSTA